MNHVVKNACLAAWIGCGLGLSPAIAMQMDLGDPVTLSPWDAQAGDGFGSCFDRSDEWLMVGSPGDELQGIDSGSVAVFSASAGGWNQLDILGSLDGQAGDHFGSSLSLSGDWCVVGSPGEGDTESRRGAVYLFHWDGARWKQTQALHAPGDRTPDHYGSSVSFDGTTLAVGASHASGKLEGSGAVYIYELFPETDVDLPRLMLSQTLRARTESASAQYGFSLDLMGDQLIIGAWGASRGVRKTGAAYVYTRKAGEWSEQQVLWPSGNQVGSCFGLSVSLSEGRCLIGAPWEDTGEDHSGGAYVFRKTPLTWTLEGHLNPNSPMPEGSFGISVSLGADNQGAILGSRRGSPQVPGAGAVSHFELNGEAWAERRLWNSHVPHPGDDYGLALDFTRLPILIGARRGDARGGLNPTGCIYVGAPGHSPASE